MINKQEIEKALSWVKEVINHQVFERATYEDTYGTGDLSEEERKEVYEEMDNNINLFKTIQCALTQQLNNGWIPVSEPPTSDGRFEVTLKGSKGKRHVEMCNYHKDAKGNPWGSKWDSVNVIAWRQRPEPYKEDKNAERN